jgi:hypothetical protein
MPQGHAKCSEEGYARDCSSCTEKESCQETSVILFYPSGKKETMDCYDCYPRKQ